jgi:hypothetical protein
MIIWRMTPTKQKPTMTNELDPLAVTRHRLGSLDSGILLRQQGGFAGSERPRPFRRYFNSPFPPDVKLFTKAKDSVVRLFGSSSAAVPVENAVDIRSRLEQRA